MGEKLEGQGDSGATSYPFIILKGETETLCSRVAAGSGVAFLEFYPRSVLGIRHLPPLEGGDSFVSREPSLDTPKYPNRILRGNLSPSESDGLRFLLGFDPSREHVEIIAASHCH